MHPRLLTRTSVLCGLVLLSAQAAYAGKPPKEEEGLWTIRCATVTGERRMARAESQAAALKRVRGLKPDLVMVHETRGEVAVYYGRYRREFRAGVAEPRFKPDPQKDLELIRSLSVIVDGQPVWPFLYATMEELPVARTSRPEWDLSNARGYWSLHVAVFFNDEVIKNRRHLAEEYCRELREQGHEAYFHHGTVNSSVCVGLFPKDAVQPITHKDPMTGAVSVTNRIVDPKLLELQRKFPDSLQNARKANEIVRDPKTGEIVRRIPISSFVVKVPQAEEAERKSAGPP